MKSANEKKAKECLRFEIGPTEVGKGAHEQKVGASAPHGRAPTEVS